MYEMMFYGGLILFALGTVVSVILFVKNDVAKIIGDLTGWNAKRAMKKIKKEKETGKGDQQESEGKTEKKSGRILLGKVREDKTDVLQKQEEEIPVFEKEKTDRIKSPSGEEVSDIFQTEEDMTVLGGEVVTEMPTTVLRDGNLFKTGEKGHDSDRHFAPTNVLKKRVKPSRILPNGISALDDDDEEYTEVLGEEKTENSDFQDEKTDVLYDNEITSLLAENDVTEVLHKENGKSSFADREN